MRNFLLATSAAALALTFSGQVSAEPSKIPVSAATVAPPTADNLVFSKDPGQAKLIDQAKPIDQATTIDKLIEQTAPEAPAADTAKPAETAKSAATAKAVAAEDAAVADRLKELAESKLSQYVPREPDRAGALVFYKARNFAPLWIASGKTAPRTAQAQAFLKDVAADGLDPADYPTPAFGDTDPARLAADELAMTNAVLTFARHASVGRVAFTRVSAAAYFDQKAPAAADVLGKLAESSDVRAALDAFHPQAPQYKALKAQLAAIRSGKSVESRNAAPEPKASVKESKARSKKGAKARGSDGAKPKTVSTDAILANMERWRWMPHELGATHVMVNIPDYTLKVVQNGKIVWSTKIVVGKPGEQATPLLTETMKFITVNPTWNVPPSIIRNEYLPALARDPNALSRIGLQMGRNKDGSIRIFQPPGERNALGRIRFNFPNRFLVYQHDTPNKNLFAHTARAYSHGCMRVQNPDQYAEVLLGLSQPEDHITAEKIRSMYGSSERTINFKRPIPVYITYQTVFQDDAGKPQARADIYGLDRDTLRELHGDRRNSDVPIARNYNSSSKPVMSAGNARTGASGNPRSREFGYPNNPGYTTWNSYERQTVGSASQPRYRFW